MKKEKNYSLLFYIQTLKLQEVAQTWADAAKIYYEITKEEISPSRLADQCKRVTLSQIDPFKYIDYLKLTPKYCEKKEAIEKPIEETKGKDAIFKPLAIRYEDWGPIFNVDLEKDSNEEIIHKVREKISNEAFLIQYLGFNPGQYEITKFDLGAWSSTLKLKDESGKLYPEKVMNDKFMVQLKKREHEVPYYTKEECERFLSEFLSKRYITPLDIFDNDREDTKEILDDNKMMVSPGLELHLGKLGSIADYEDYSTKQAMWRLRQVAKEILEYQKAMKASYLLLGIGNDFFNSDTIDDKTSGETSQNNDTRHKEVFLWGKIGYLRLIETLKTEFKKVILRCNPGNHDEKTSFNLYTNLCDVYEETNDPKVETDGTYEGLRNITYYVFGKNLMVFNHGKFYDSKNLSDKDIAESIKNLFPREFHEAYHINVFVGHLHQDRESKYDNVNIFRTASLTGIDTYHGDNLFLGQRQGHSVYLFDKEKGYLGKHNITIDGNDKHRKIPGIPRLPEIDVKKHMKRSLNLSNPTINAELQEKNLEQVDKQLETFDKKTEQLIKLIANEKLTPEELKAEVIKTIGWDEEIARLEDQKGNIKTLINSYNKKTS